MIHHPSHDSISPLTAGPDGSRDGWRGAPVAHPIAAGADNAFACVPCIPGTYSTSSGACCCASCCVCTSDVLRHACACVHGVEQFKLRGVSKEKRPFLNSPLFLLGTGSPM
jgi:hypothetical protein